MPDQLLSIIPKSKKIHQSEIYKRKSDYVNNSQLRNLGKISSSSFYTDGKYTRSPLPFKQLL